MADRAPNRRDFLKTGAIFVGATALVGLGGVAYTRKLEPSWVDITNLRLTLKRLSPAFNGFRLVQISDIHMDDWMTRSRLEQIVQQVNSQSPDLVAITGDFVTENPALYKPDLVAALSRLQAQHGVVAVLGNHDYWSNPVTVRETLQASSIRELPNQVFSLHRDQSILHIAGVDCTYEGYDRLDEVLDALPENGAAVLLAHEPDYADTSGASGRFDLQISGHSHGGQVVLPFLGPPFLPLHARKYPLGLYHTNGMLHYTNRGLGMVHMRLRLNCRPEITVFEFYSA